jgi:outer membrane lipoprotein-sorting protein
MNRKRNLLILVGVVILLAALVSGFVLMQTSAEDVLVKTLETMETIEDAHAVIELDLDSVEKSGSATIEVWARQGEDGHGAFRMHVLETSEADAAGAMFVSDGETVWAYKPSENQVIVGTTEEAKAMMAEQEFGMGGFDRGEHEDGDYQHPQNAEEAVAMLLEYFTADSKSSDEINGESAYKLELVPIAEQMPAEYVAVGGFLNLWVDKASSLPIAVEYTGGSMGEFSATASGIEINTGLDDSLFVFDIPAGVEVLTFADLEPQSLTLDEAAGAAEFEFLTPTETPDGATLVDVLEVQGVIVQRYTLPDGGSFTIAQGAGGDAPVPPIEGQPVEVRGVSGTLYVAEDGDQVLLTWSENGVYFSVAGDLTTEQALSIAESLQ